MTRGDLLIRIGLGLGLAAGVVAWLWAATILSSGAAA